MIPETQDKDEKTEPKRAPLSITVITALIMLAAIVNLGLILYFKKTEF